MNLQFSQQNEKRMTKFLRWFTSGCLFFSFFSHASPMYWIAEKDNVQYLLIGTLHVGDKSMYPLPREITQYLKKSNGLILEADLTSETTPTYPTDTLTAEEVLTSEQQHKLSKIADELQVSFYRLSHQPPWSAAITLQMTQLAQLGYSAEYGVDQHLISLAQRYQRPILGLESLQSQLNMLSEQKDNGKELLLSAIDEWDSNKTNSLCMVESWKAGDKANFKDLIKKIAMSKQLSNALEVNRNKNWAKKLASNHFLPTQSGRYVVAVGLLHLIGQKNLITLLSKEGFSIMPKGKEQQAECDFTG
jgi:hypothetical protein